MRLLAAACLAALCATPAVAAPWQTMSDESNPDDAIYVAWQDSDVTGYSLFFDCYKPMQAYSIGVMSETDWDATATYPTDVAVTFTVDGTELEAKGFEFAEQGGKTVLVTYAHRDGEQFESIFQAIQNAESEIIVGYLDGAVGFRAEGVWDAVGVVVEGCMDE